MNIVVFIKQVPDTTEIRIDPVTGNLVREGVPSIVNPDDKHALEEALSLREKHRGEVTVITMGPPQAEEALRECIAMGADRTILLSDKAFSGADTCATSYTLSCALKKLGKFDLVLCGRQALDGNTAQVGPQIAELQKLPQITYSQGVEINNGAIKVKRALEDGYEVVETELPVLLTVIKDINTPRTPAIDAVMEAYSAEITTWTAEDLDVDRTLLGLKGSPTRIKKAYTPEQKKGNVDIIDASNPEKAVQELLAKLKEKHLLDELEG